MNAHPQNFWKSFIYGILSNMHGPRTDNFFLSLEVAVQLHIKRPSQRQDFDMGQQHKLEQL